MLTEEELDVEALAEELRLMMEEELDAEEAADYQRLTPQERETKAERKFRQGRLKARRKNARFSVNKKEKKLKARRRRKTVVEKPTKHECHKNATVCRDRCERRLMRKGFFEGERIIEDARSISYVPISVEEISKRQHAELSNLQGFGYVRIKGKVLYLTPEVVDALKQFVDSTGALPRYSEQQLTEARDFLRTDFIVSYA